MNNRGGKFTVAECGGDVIIHPEHIPPLSSRVIMVGRWLPLPPSLCTVEHCEPHEIKLPLERRLALFTGTPLFSPPLWPLHPALTPSSLLFSPSPRHLGGRENEVERRKCSGPLRSHKLYIFILSRLPKSAGECIRGVHKSQHCQSGNGDARGRRRWVHSRPGILCQISSNRNSFRRPNVFLMQPRDLCCCQSAGLIGMPGRWWAADRDQGRWQRLIDVAEESHV